jgi:hypothetical protein
MAVIADQRRALEMLSSAHHSLTEATMLANGFKPEVLTSLVRVGLATAEPDTVRAGKRQIEIVRMTITDAGRRALAGCL